jgi:HSP20 family protein
MKTFDDLRQGVASWRDSLAEGWERLRRSAAGTLTHFRPGAKTDLPPQQDLDDPAMPGTGWALMGGDLFEDERRIVVRLEAPGLEKPDFDIRIVDDQTLQVRGDKRFEREHTDGRWRMVQCAYGSFQRTFALPAPVQADDAKATYRNGVLRIELRKRKAQAPAPARTITVR